MPKLRKLILNCPEGYKPELDALLEHFIRNGLVYVGVVGKDCEKIEDIIDEIVVGDGSETRPFVLTTSHPNESVDDAIEFAMCLTGEHAGEVQVVTL